MEIRGYSVSVAKDAGSTNEDSILVDESRRLFIVADGMGGTAAGNIASEAAVQLIASKIDEQSDLIAAFNQGESSREEVLAVLENAVQEAGQSVFEMAQNSPQQRGMGTTISGIITDEDPWIYRTCRSQSNLHSSAIRSRATHRGPLFICRAHTTRAYATNQCECRQAYGLGLSARYLCTRSGGYL